MVFRLWISVPRGVCVPLPLGLRAWMFKARLPEIRQTCQTCLTNFENVWRQAPGSSDRMSSGSKMVQCLTRCYWLVRHHDTRLKFTELSEYFDFVAFKYDLFMCLKLLSHNFSHFVNWKWLAKKIMFASRVLCGIEKVPAKTQSQTLQIAYQNCKKGILRVLGWQ